MDPVVPPEITAELTQILSNLVQGDNEIRQKYVFFNSLTTFPTFSLQCRTGSQRAACPDSRALSPRSRTVRHHRRARCHAFIFTRPPSPSLVPTITGRIPASPASPDALRPSLLKHPHHTPAPPPPFPIPRALPRCTQKGRRHHHRPRKPGNGQRSALACPPGPSLLHGPIPGR